MLSEAAPDALVPGAVAVAAAVWLSLRLIPARDPLALWRLARHLPRFVTRSVVGGVDVARRALDPAMPLRPGWVEVPVDLPDGARVALGAELSLMPGTLAAGCNEGRLMVHLLDTGAGFEAGITREASEIAAIIGRAGRGAP